MGTYINTHAGDDTLKKVLLLQITLDVVYYFTNYDIPVYTGGTYLAPSAKWVPLPFTVSGLSSNQGQLSPTGSLTLPNADGELGSLFLSLPSMSGLEVKLYEGWLSPTSGTTVTQDEALLIQGVTDSVSIQREEIALNIGAYVPLKGKILPRRKINHACQFEYKSSICGATGTDTVCDKSLAECAMPTKIASTGILTHVIDSAYYTTFTTSNPHGLVTTDIFQVYDCSDSSYNMTAIVTSYTTYTFTTSTAHADEALKPITGFVNKGYRGNMARFGGFPIIQGVN